MLGKRWRGDALAHNSGALIRALLAPGQGDGLGRVPSVKSCRTIPASAVAAVMAAERASECTEALDNCRRSLDIAGLRTWCSLRADDDQQKRQQLQLELPCGSLMRQQPQRGGERLSLQRANERQWLQFFRVFWHLAGLLLLTLHGIGRRLGSGRLPANALYSFHIFSVPSVKTHAP